MLNNALSPLKEIREQLKDVEGDLWFTEWEIANADRYFANAIRPPTITVLPCQIFEIT